MRLRVRVRALCNGVVDSVKAVAEYNVATNANQGSTYTWTTCLKRVPVLI